MEGLLVAGRDFGAYAFGTQLFGESIAVVVDDDDDETPVVTPAVAVASGGPLYSTLNSRAVYEGLILR